MTVEFAFVYILLENDKIRFETWNQSEFVQIFSELWLNFDFVFFLYFFFYKTESILSKEMELVIKDIKNTTQKKYMDYGKNPGSPDNDFLFMYSVAR